MQKPRATLEGLEPRAPGQQAQREQGEGVGEVLGLGVEGGGEGRGEQVLEGLVADHAPQAGGQILRVEGRGGRGPQRIEPPQVPQHLERQPQQAHLGARREKPRREQSPGRCEAHGVQPAVAQDRVAGTGDRPHAGGEPERVRHGVQVPIAARDELGTAIEAKLAAGLGAHASAGHGLALQHLDVVAGPPQPPGAGEARDTAPHHDDRCHA